MGVGYGGSPIRHDKSRSSPRPSCAALHFLPRGLNRTARASRTSKEASGPSDRYRVVADQRRVARQTLAE